MDELPAHILFFISAYGRRIQIIGKEEKAQYEEHDEEFHQNNEP
jgi:hypothetical protein